MDALSTLLSHEHYLNGTRYYSLKVAGDWAYSLTSKETIYFYLVQSGSFCIQIGELSQTVHAGDIVMIPDANEHVCHALDHNGNNAKALGDTLSVYDEGTIDLTENSTLNAHFLLVECQYDKEVIQPLLAVLPAILPEHHDMPESRFEVIDRAIGMLTLESKSERLGKLTLINLWTSIIMVECLRTYIESLPETTNNWLVAMTDPHLSRALTGMHSMPNHRWTTHNLAEEAGMSRSSFTEHFKEVVGVPPLTYLIDLRLRIAARHLRLQQYNIGQIGDMVGYASNSTFSQAFKRLYDMSPRAYRQQYLI